jgi:hypothetical protein
LKDQKNELINSSVKNSLPHLVLECCFVFQRQKETKKGEKNGRKCKTRGKNEEEEILTC